MEKKSLEKDTLHLEGNNAASFLEYMNRKRTPEEVALYKEADEFYNSKCKL